MGLHCETSQFLKIDEKIHFWQITGETALAGVWKTVEKFKQTCKCLQVSTENKGKSRDKHLKKVGIIGVKK